MRLPARLGGTMSVSEMAGQDVQPFRPGSSQADDEGAETGLGPLPYVVASLSTLPVLGWVFALVAIPWGISTLSRGGKLVAIIGVLGIGTQLLLAVGALHFFAFR